MDVELMFLGVMVVGVFVLTLVFIWHWISNKASGGKRASSKATAANGNGAPVNEYMTKKGGANQAAPGKAFFF